MRTRYLMALLLTTGICFSQASDKRPGGCVGCFSEPQSLLLFRGAYDELYLVAPSGNFTVPMLHGWVGQNASPIPAISPSGDQVAWSLTFMLNADSVKCDPSNKRWCDLKPKPIYKSVLGVYLVRDKAWKQYGDFNQVGSAAFSPDGKKIAFTCDDGLTILDLATGQMKTVPGPGPRSVFWIDQLSWSPDGKFLVGSVNAPGFGRIVVIDLATGETKTIAEGSNPSWSPKGDWIAYGFMIIHPNGTGARSVLEREHKWMNWEVDAPIVWSPDGEKLLLNQRNSDAAGSRVIMVNLATGHAVRVFKNGEVVVSGWVAEKP